MITVKVRGTNQQTTIPNKTSLAIIDITDRVEPPVIVEWWDGGKLISETCPILVPLEPGNQLKSSLRL